MGALTNASVNTLLTVPTDHKFEVVDVSYSHTLATAATFYLIASGTGAGAVDEVTIAPGKLIEHRQYSSLVLYEGWTLAVIPVFTGADSCGCSVSYVDVDFTT